MTDYCKASIAVVYSENADYTDAEWGIDDSSWDPYEFLPTEQWGPSKVLVATAGTTLTPSGFQSTSAMLLFKSRHQQLRAGWLDGRLDNGLRGPGACWWNSGGACDQPGDCSCGDRERCGVLL